MELKSERSDLKNEMPSLQRGSTIYGQVLRGMWNDAFGCATTGISGTSGNTILRAIVPGDECSARLWRRRLRRGRLRRRRDARS
jgi:hypothetical protein